MAGAGRDRVVAKVECATLLADRVAIGVLKAVIFKSDMGWVLQRETGLKLHAGHLDRRL